jgi:hypothetical protein
MDEEKVPAGLPLSALSITDSTQLILVGHLDALFKWRKTLVGESYRTITKSI